MRFSELLAQVSFSGSNMRICTDSRRVKKGDIFVAIAGANVNGHDFIDEALSKGAACVVCERYEGNSNAEVMVVPSTPAALGLLAQAGQGNPSAQLISLAVTGTNGKTTVSYLVRSVIRMAGQNCGLVGTITYDTGSSAKEATLTTPDQIQIAQIARETVQVGARFMMMEASSHALSQDRLAAIDFTAAAFTNLTGDHLDYHGTMEEYLAAKVKLFSSLAPGATAVLNADSPAAQEIALRINARILWYGIDAKTDITCHIESMNAVQTVYTLEYAGQKQLIKTSLIGKHNVSNHLAAAGLCLAAGFDLSAVAAGLSALKAVPGRLDPVKSGRDFTVLIDYAHTDDALKNVLTALKQLCRGRLTVVFGCGGDRDRTKRPRMAKVAEELADCVIVTSDNPRTEPPQEIINDITAGFATFDSGRITVEADRQKAIALAVKNARKDDIVLIAGKGHETYQIRGTKKIDFNDAQIAKEFLEDTK